MVPDGHDADFLRKTILDHYNMSLGTGLAKVAGKIFRIGHLGDFNELMLAGTLAGVEMGLMKSNIPYKKGGILKALEYLCWKKGGDFSLPPSPHRFRINDSLHFYEHFLVESFPY